MFYHQNLCYAIIEEHLVIDEIRETYGWEIVHVFNPPIVIHISRQLIVDYPLTGYIVMKILTVEGALVHQN